MKQSNTWLGDIWREAVVENLSYEGIHLTPVEDKRYRILYCLNGSSELVALPFAEEKERRPGIWWLNLRVLKGRKYSFVLCLCKTIEGSGKEDIYLFLLPPDVVRYVLRKTTRTKEMDAYKIRIRESGSRFLVTFPRNRGGGVLDITPYKDNFEPLKRA
jgi:hypothetical protein